MLSSASIVVEVRCTAPRRDWPELAVLLRSYLCQVWLLSQERGVCFPFYPGKCVLWNSADSGASLPEPPPPPLLLHGGIRTLRVCDMTDPSLLAPLPSRCCAGDAPFTAVFFRLQDDPLCEERGTDEEGEAGGGLPSSTVLSLPHRTLEGLWESLSYGESLSDSISMKRDLVEYVLTAMTFSMAGVDAHCVTWNRMVLLHGPPGTGKTSLCKALAHKLAVRLCGAAAHSHESTGSRRSSGSGLPFPAAGGAASPPSVPRSLFARARLVEVNAHSLFSRWFSESGKQVMQLFSHIRSVAADPACLVCVLLDEVESLAAARQSAMKGNEPSDSIRVVNALLTQMDRLQAMRNVLVLTTSNLTGAIDVAFLDRADKRVCVGPPGWEARRSILQCAVNELLHRGLLHFLSHKPKAEEHHAGRDGEEETDEGIPSADAMEEVVSAVGAVAATCVGFNGRLLKKLPFLAYGACMSSGEGFGRDAAAKEATATAAPPPCVQRTLKPDYVAREEAEVEGDGDEDGDDGGGEGVGGCFTLPSVPINVYLRHLHEAAYQARETEAQLAATQQHLTKDAKDSR